MIFYYVLCVITIISFNDICLARICISSHDERELLLAKAATVRCHSDYQACFTRWNSVNGTDVIGEQGCLNVGSHDICSVTDCVEKTGGSSSNFCCCYSDLCNQNFTKAKDHSPNKDIFDQKKRIENWRENARTEFENSFNGAEYTRTYCGYHDNSKMQANDTVEYESEQLPGTLMKDSDTVLCPGDDFCFTVWQVMTSMNDTEVVVVKQGCWQRTDDKYCTVGQCIANRRFAKSAPTTRYCCCYGNMCNVNMTDMYDPLQHTTEDMLIPSTKRLSEEYSQYKERTIIISLVSVASVALIIFGVFLLYRLCLVSKKSSSDSLHLVEAPPPRGIDFEGLEIEKQICRGRNSEVWQGTMGHVNVAVKMFTSNHKQLFSNEKYIYSLPFMEHENLLKFYGCDERLTMEGYKQYWMILSYCPVGNLQSYLKNNTLDWSTFCQMTLTIVRGLSHLHTEIEKGDQFKPTIAHRDINSRNILVNPDNTCVVGDLGFAIATVGSKLMKNGHYESAEQASLQDVGTLRYMAPELLDGAANLRESETSLKQIDIYALGLVIWEMATRCTCLYNGVPVPEYSLPYQKEAGLHPTFEEMQMHVSRNKVRPKFSEVWKDYNQAVRSLKDTMEDCWDHDAEARLTAMCVEERITDMMFLWTQESKHKVPTPMLTTTSNLFTYPSNYNIDQPVSDVSSRPEPRVAEQTVHRPEMSDLTDSSTAHLIVTSPPNADISRDIRNSFSRRGMSVSNSTMETFISTTPSEGETFQKNFLMMMEKNNCVLQPHQGRNPTVERNTHKRSDEELAISGNTLVYGNEVHNNMLSLNDNALDNVNENLETSLVQSDVLNMNTRHVHAPIPYLQNQVHRTDTGTRPKNANILNAGNNTANNLNNTETKKPFLTRLFGPKGFNPLGIFHLGSKSSVSSHESGNVQSQSDSGVPINVRLDTPHVNSGPRQSRDVNLTIDNSTSRPNQHSANIYNQTSKPSNHTLSEQRPRDFIVALQNGKPVVMPTNITLSNQIGSETSEESSGPDDNHLPNLNDQIGIARMEMFQPQKLKLVLKGEEQTSNNQYSKSTSDLSPLHVNKEFDDNIYKLRRPDSLKLKGHNYKDKEWNLNSSQTYPQKNLKIKHRVKTPVKVKHGRFSLYDDRLMSQFVNENPVENKYLKKTSASMNQIKKCCDGNANSINISDHIC